MYTNVTVNKRKIAVTAVPSLQCQQQLCYLHDLRRLIGILSVRRHVTRAVLSE